MRDITNHLPTAELQALDAAHHMHPFTANAELAKHGARVITRADGVTLTDSEGEQIFFNQPLIGAPDEKHSDTEERVYALGQTDAGKKLFVVCTIRGKLIRIISARPMNRREREVYESHEQEA